MQAISFVEKRDRAECKCEGVSTLCPSPPFPPSPFPFPLHVPCSRFRQAVLSLGPWGLGVGVLIAALYQQKGKGMWAKPILWAVSKQPLCNLWLGEVVRGEGAACLSSVGLHKCAFQIRVGGHVWLHGHNDFPHIYTLGPANTCIPYSVQCHAKSKHLSSPECFIPDFLSCSACLAIASL